MIEPTHARSLPMVTRIAHNYTRSTHEDIGTGSFAYDVVANGTRRLHDGLTTSCLGVKCIPECVPKASHDYPMLCKNQLNKCGFSIDIISHV